MQWKNIKPNNYAVAAIISAIAFIAGLFFKKNLFYYPWVFGSPVAGLFIPPFASLSFFVFAALKEKINYRHFLVSAAIFFISVLPFSQSLFQDVKNFWWDDGYRYSVPAHNMVDKKTLWGGDKLVAKTNNNRYTYQAGYRYFLALEFLIFRHENRLLQVINIFLWCFVVCAFMQSLQNLFLPDILNNLILFFLLGASVYACKNILMNLSEWFFVLLMLLYLILLLKNKITPAIIFLSLAVFVRQNQLPIILLLFLLTIIQTNKKIITSFVFILILLLPVYHNLYYDHSLSFFPDYVKYALFIPTSTGNQFLDFLLMLRNTAIHYLGFDWQRSLSVNFFGIIFIPTAVIAVFLMFKNLNSFNRKIFIYSIALILLSSIVMNYAYFPRFEFANLFCMMISFLILWRFQLRLTDVKNIL